MSEQAKLTDFEKIASQFMQGIEARLKSVEEDVRWIRRRFEALDQMQQDHFRSIDPQRNR